MGTDDAMYEVFGPLEQGAPGNEASTLRALDTVPGRDTVREVLDLGAGHGRTTFTLAQALREARVAELAGRVDANVSKVLEMLRKEIDVVRRFSDAAGYTFFVLQRADD